MAISRSNELARTTQQNGSLNDALTFVPRIDVLQLADKVVIHADLPGLDADDVRVTCDRGALIVEGERRYEHEGHEGEMIRAERAYGRFHRVIPLPEGADAAQADAHFENGVLEITIPAPLTERGKTIEIKPGRH
jgi:HSP20 family protein